MIDVAAARSFLSGGTVAVVGASPARGNFGAVVVQALRAHRVPTVTVHPGEARVGDVDRYDSVAAVPEPLHGAIIMLPAPAAAAVVGECIRAGIPRVWLFQGFGTGAVSDDAVRQCDDAGVEVIAGACPLMFLEPVRGVHRVHRTVRRARRAIG